MKIYEFFENLKSSSNGSEINRCQFKNDHYGPLIDISIQCSIKTGTHGLGCPKLTHITLGHEASQRASQTELFKPYQIRINLEILLDETELFKS